jgi:hypothetical protein
LVNPHRPEIRTFDTPKSLVPSKDDALASPGLLELRAVALTTKL